MAAPLNPKDLAPMVKDLEIIQWDERKGGIVANKELRIGNIVLQSKPLQNPDKDKIIEAICSILAKDGEQLLDFNDKVINLQNRMLSLQKWNSEDGWPDFSTTELLKTVNKWLSPYLDKVKRSEDLKKLDLYSILLHSLDWEKQQALDLLVPERIEVPSGSNIKINYQSNGDKPVIPVRIQEIFGMTDTPTINKGKTSLLLHLLSPASRPVQITEDLNSFWRNANFEVKKDLKARYPKHAWPDDPLNAKAIRGVKKR